MKLKLARDALIVTIFVLSGVLLAFGQGKLDFVGATWRCPRKLLEQNTIAGVQDSRRGVKSRLDHPGEEKCAGGAR